MKHRYTPLCLYSKDIAQITGKSYRQACRIHRKIKQHYQKGPEQYLSIAEFSAYTGIPESLIREQLF